jgi:hypothetical protein
MDICHEVCLWSKIIIFEWCMKILKYVSSEHQYYQYSYFEFTITFDNISGWSSLQYGKYCHMDKYLDCVQFKKTWNMELNIKPSGSSQTQQILRVGGFGPRFGTTNYVRVRCSPVLDPDPNPWVGSTPNPQLGNLRPFLTLPIKQCVHVFQYKYHHYYFIVKNFIVCFGLIPWGV